MSAPIDPTTITKMGAFTAFTNADVDYWSIDPTACTGLGGPDGRITEEDVPGGPGVLIEDVLDGGWVISLVGDVIATSVGASSEPGYRAAVRAVVASIKSAHDALKTAADDLTHTDGTEQIRYHSKIEPVWTSFHVCQVTLGVIVDVFA